MDRVFSVLSFFFILRLVTSFRASFSPIAGNLESSLMDKNVLSFEEYKNSPSSSSTEQYNFTLITRE